MSIRINTNISSLEHALDDWHSHINNKNMTEAHLVNLCKEIENNSIAIINKISRTHQVENQKTILTYMKMELESVYSELNSFKQTHKLGLQILNISKETESQIGKFRSTVNDLQRQIIELEQHGMVIDSFRIPKSLREIFSEAAHYLSPVTLFKKLIVRLLNLSKEFSSIQIKLYSAAHKKNYIKKLQNEFISYQKELNKLQEIHSDLLAKFESSQRDKKIEEQLVKAASARNKLASKMNDIRAKIEKFESNQRLSEEVHQNMHAIGGEIVKLHIEQDGVVLDGMYLSADKFKATLKEAGGTLFTLEAMLQDGSGKKATVNGINFPKELFNESAIKNQLEKLGVFPKEGEETASSSWVQIEFEDQVLIMSTEEAQKFRNINLVDLNITIKEIDLTPNPNRGTAIITSGNIGVYEMHKKEMMAFLIQGMDVMSFNFRGYGESTGVPSAVGMNKDMEAAYQYVKEKYKTPDSKILFKALCMSGGPATYIAAKHPNVNIILDQSFADFKDVVKRQARKQVREFVETYFKDLPLKRKIANRLLNWVSLDWVVDVLSWLTTIPDWKTRREIGRIKGHIGLLYAKQDEMMTRDADITINYKAIVENAFPKRVAIAAMEGEHGTSWLASQEILYPISISSMEEARQTETAFIQRHSDVFNNLPFLKMHYSDAKSIAKEIESEETEKTQVKSDDLMKFFERMTIELRDDDATIQEKIEQDLTNYVPEVAPVYRKFMKQAIIKPNLLTTFNRIKESIERRGFKRPDQIYNVANSYIEEDFPPEIRDLAKKYIFSVIKFDEQALPSPHKGETYVGREFIYNFLKRAGLSHPIIA